MKKTRAIASNTSMVDSSSCNLNEIKLESTFLRWSVGC